jgi:hypothetical protein
MLQAYVTYWPLHNIKTNSSVVFSIAKLEDQFYLNQHFMYLICVPSKQSSN